MFDLPKKGAFEGFDLVSDNSGNFFKVSRANLSELMHGPESDQEPDEKNKRPKPGWRALYHL